MPYPTSVDANVPIPWLFESGEPSSGVTATLAANTTYLVALTTLASVTVTAMRYRDTIIGGNCDLGLYDANGNLLGHTGVTAITATGVNLVSLQTPTVVPAGRFYMAFWIDNATASVMRTNTANENMSNVLISVSTNTGGLASTFAGMGGVTSPAAIRVMMSAVVQGGLS